MSVYCKINVNFSNVYWCEFRIIIKMLIMGKIVYVYFNLYERY